VYETAIEALGTLGGPESVEALKTALYDGEWWAPFRTSAIRSMVVEALGQTQTPEALTVLQDAAAMGSRGVRSAARQQIARGVSPARGAREQESKEPSA
jgi:HEAT repeat protein